MSVLLLFPFWYRIQTHDLTLAPEPHPGLPDQCELTSAGRKSSSGFGFQIRASLAFTILLRPLHHLDGSRVPRSAQTRPCDFLWTAEAEVNRLPLSRQKGDHLQFGQQHLGACGWLCWKPLSCRREHLLYDEPEDYGPVGLPSCDGWVIPQGSEEKVSLPPATHVLQCTAQLPTETTGPQRSTLLRALQDRPCTHPPTFHPSVHPSIHVCMYLCIHPSVHS